MKQVRETLVSFMSKVEAKLVTPRAVDEEMSRLLRDLMQHMGMDPLVDPIETVQDELAEARKVLGLDE